MHVEVLFVGGVSGLEETGLVVIVGGLCCTWGVCLVVSCSTNLRYTGWTSW